MPKSPSAHPVLFLVLFLPMGIPNGYVVVTLGYLLTHAGVSVAAVAALVAVFMVPQMWKVLWAPLVDTTLTTKSWFCLSAVVIGILMTATSLVPHPEAHLGLIRLLVIGSSLASTFNMMAADSLMAHATTDADKGRAGGWSQAGNLGGFGLGGGAGLWLAQHTTGGWEAGAALGAVCLISALALIPLREPARVRDGGYLKNLIALGADILDIVRKRLGFLALVLMTLPIGTGAAQNLWAAVADAWRASADVVALVTGVLGGVISMFGCILGGILCDRLDRKQAYCLFGALLAVCTAAMALAPHSPAMFVLFTSLYAFVVGMCYAAFGAVVLEAIGKGAAATKYNLLAGIANLPIAYLTTVDGWADGRWGAGGMLLTEAAAGIAGIALFAAIALVSRAALARKHAGH